MGLTQEVSDGMGEAMGRDMATASAKRIKDLETLVQAQAQLINQYIGFVQPEAPEWATVPVQQKSTNQMIEHMVTGFLGWRLPGNFQPDAGIYFEPPVHPNSWPVGTNLLTANQAREMVEHMVRGL